MPGPCNPYCDTGGEPCRDLCFLELHYLERDVEFFIYFWLLKPRSVGVVRVNWLCLETALCYSINWVIPITSIKEQQMSRFQKLSHVLWHCQYHIVWTPKYRFRVLKDQVSREVNNCINIFSGKLGCEIVDLSIQSDHIHLIINVPPKVSISQLLGTVKGRTAIRVFKQFPYLKQKP